MEIRPARDSDLAEITSIFNHEVEHSAPIWVETPVTLADRRTWLAARQADGFPVLVAKADGQVLGFASYGGCRPYEGFRQTVEHMTYVSPTARGRDVGRALLAALVSAAWSQGRKVIVGFGTGRNRPLQDPKQATYFLSLISSSDI
jgi:phosphinothricin acetyltransferase